LSHEELFFVWDVGVVDDAQKMVRFASRHVKKPFENLHVFQPSGEIFVVVLQAVFVVGGEQNGHVRVGTDARRSHGDVLSRVAIEGSVMPSRKIKLGQLLIETDLVPHVVIPIDTGDGVDRLVGRNRKSVVDGFLLTIHDLLKHVGGEFSYDELGGHERLPKTIELGFRKRPKPRYDVLEGLQKPLDKHRFSGFSFSVDGHGGENAYPRTLLKLELVQDGNGTALVEGVCVQSQRNSFWFFFFIFA
jgi:hypothetical protein